MVFWIARTEISCYPKRTCATRKKHDTMTSNMEKFNKKGIKRHEKEHKSRDQSIFSSMYATHAFAWGGVFDTRSGWISSIRRRLGRGV